MTLKEKQTLMDALAAVLKLAEEYVIADSMPDGFIDGMRFACGAIEERLLNPYNENPAD